MKTKRRLSAHCAALALSLCVGMTTSPVHAQDNASTKATENQTVAVSGKSGKAALPTGVQGLVAFRDPVTGKLRAPSREEIQALGRQHRVNGRRIGRLHGNGASSLVVAPDFLSYSVARRTADGNIETGCVKNEAEADAFFTSKKQEVRNDR